MNKKNIYKSIYHIAKKKKRKKEKQKKKKKLINM